MKRQRLILPPLVQTGELTQTRLPFEDYLLSARKLEEEQAVKLAPASTWHRLFSTIITTITGEEVVLGDNDTINTHDRSKSLEERFAGSQVKSIPLQNLLRAVHAGIQAGQATTAEELRWRQTEDGGLYLPNQANIGGLPPNMGVVGLVLATQALNDQPRKRTN